VKARRLTLLVWPVTLMVAGGLTAVLAEAAAGSVATASLYGMIKLVSDLVLLIACLWLLVALVRIARFKPAARRA